jgi:hypothetical protein
MTRLATSPPGEKLRCDAFGGESSHGPCRDIAADVDKGEVFGDSAYGTGAFQQFLDDHDITSGCKTQPMSAPAGGMFSKEQCTINLDRDTVTCPNQVTVRPPRSSRRRSWHCPVPQGVPRLPVMQFVHDQPGGSHGSASTPMRRRLLRRVPGTVATQIHQARSIMAPSAVTTVAGQ